MEPVNYDEGDKKETKAGRAIIYVVSVEATSKSNWFLKSSFMLKKGEV
jgi:hypothetical protein